MSWVHVCDRDDMRTVAGWLGDTPETTISVHLLRRGRCRVVIVGAPDAPFAVIVQGDDAPDEPVAFGDDAGAIWRALRTLPGWTCVNVAPAIATDLAALMRREVGRTIRTLDDIYHTLERPAPRISHPDVRRLTPDDLTLLETAPASLQGAGFGDAAALLAEGIVAGGLVDGALATIAHTSALTARHADIGVATREDQRGCGLATTTAALVASAVRATRRTPVWSCGATNAASLRVAAKLGFREVSRRVYLLPDRSS